MAERLKREQKLRELLDDNFAVSKHCRKTVGAIEDASLKYFFQTIASKRAQYAIEISDEITFYGGKVPYIPPAAYERPWPKISDGKKLRTIKACLKLHKESHKKYCEALSRINDGSCREILLRHKAAIEKTIFELKGIKKLIKTYQSPHGKTSLNQSTNEIY